MNNNINYIVSLLRFLSNFVIQLKEKYKKSRSRKDQ